MSDEAWFRPKRYGYGATPTNWKGWAFTFGMAALMVALRFLLLPPQSGRFLLGSGRLARRSAGCRQRKKLKPFALAVGQAADR